MKNYIEDMSFHQKLTKLRAGIIIPPPDRINRNLDIFKVQEIALGYTTRGEFVGADNAAYKWAHRHGILDEVCQHMETAKRGPKS
jgi:hypothetical protein